MTVSFADNIREIHERGRKNQTPMRLRVNSGLSSLFGAGMLGTLSIALLDAAPWWAVLIVGSLLAVGEVLAQAFSKSPLTPSQVETLTREAEALQAEINPEPTPVEVQLSEMSEGLRSVLDRVDNLVRDQELVAEALAAADAPDPDDDLRAAYKDL
jgi:hypothetical protein